MLLAGKIHCGFELACLSMSSEISATLSMDIERHTSSAVLSRRIFGSIDMTNGKLLVHVFFFFYVNG